MAEQARSGVHPSTERQTTIEHKHSFHQFILMPVQDVNGRPKSAGISSAQDKQDTRWKEYLFLETFQPQYSRAVSWKRNKWNSVRKNIYPPSPAWNVTRSKGHVRFMAYVTIISEYLRTRNHQKANAVDIEGWSCSAILSQQQQQERPRSRKTWLSEGAAAVKFVPVTPGWKMTVS